MSPIDIGGTDHVAGWNGDTRDFAARHWLYAQLSINAYEDYEAFTLPGDIVQRPGLGNDGTGYAYVIFDRFEGPRLVESIIAYRGTETAFSDAIPDVFLGNLLGLQHDRGLSTAAAVHGQLQSSQHGAAELAVTGHSLGGGIALHVSDHELDGSGAIVTRTVVFNSMPRLAGFDDPQRDRVALVERGDFLGVVRVLGSAPDGLYRSINCQQGFGPGRDHSMRQLAECLTWIAAFEDPAARLSMAQNPLIGRPESQVNTDEPPVPAEWRAGIPVNPHAADPELARLLHVHLTASDVLQPLYDTRAGWRLHVERAAQPGGLTSYLVLNGIERARAENSCGNEDALSACIAAIVSAGEAIVQDHALRPEAP